MADALSYRCPPDIEWPVAPRPHLIQVYAMLSFMFRPQKRISGEPLIVVLSVWFASASIAPNIVRSQDLAGQDALTAAEFHRRAIEILPVEQRYEYHRTFDSGSIHKPLRDVDAVAGENEIVIDANWRIFASSTVGPLTSFGIDDTIEYLRESMLLRGVARIPSSDANWDNMSKVIMVGTCDDFDTLSTNSDIGRQLRGTARLRNPHKAGPDRCLWI